jgi:hypothetical protein
MISSDLEGFDEFWKIYPRRVGKQAAIRMYKRALKLTTAEKILRAAKSYASEREGKEMQFTAHPATWLNAGRWDDYEQLSVPVSAAVSGVYVRFNERDAWDAYGRSVGKSYPRDKAGGWWFPSKNPPEHRA